MCETEIKEYVHHDGSIREWQYPSLCRNSVNGRPCGRHRITRRPAAHVNVRDESPSNMLSGSVASSSSGSYPPTPSSATIVDAIPATTSGRSGSGGREKRYPSSRPLSLVIDLGHKKSKSKDSSKRSSRQSTTSRGSSEDVFVADSPISGTFSTTYVTTTSPGRAAQQLATYESFPTPHEASSYGYPTTQPAAGGDGGGRPPRPPARATAADPSPPDSPSTRRSGRQPSYNVRVHNPPQAPLQAAQRRPSIRTQRPPPIDTGVSSPRRVAFEDEDDGDAGRFSAREQSREAERLRRAREDEAERVLRAERERGSAREQTRQQNRADEFTAAYETTRAEIREQAREASRRARAEREARSQARASQGPRRHGSRSRRPSNAGQQQQQTGPDSDALRETYAQMARERAATEAREQVESRIETDRDLYSPRVLSSPSASRPPPQRRPSNAGTRPAVALYQPTGPHSPETGRARGERVIGQARAEAQARALQDQMGVDDGASTFGPPLRRSNSAARGSARPPAAGARYYIDQYGKRVYW